MTFLYPTYFWALFLILIPIIIHIFKFRRYTTVYFSNVRALSQLKKEKKQQKHLKELLILASRILAIAFLVTAFAHPFIPPKNASGTANFDRAGIYIDNSFSMLAGSEGNNLLEQAKQEALNLANTYPADTKFALVTNDLSLQNQRLLDRSMLINRISALEATPVRPQLSQVMRVLSTRLKSENSSGATPVYLFSDFQKNIADIQQIKTDTLMSLNVDLLKAKQVNNLLVDSAWFAVPGRIKGTAETLYARVKNNGDQELTDVPMRYIENDSLRAVTSFDLKPNQKKTVSLKFTARSAGIKNARVELTDYPVTYDNTLYLGFRVTERINALVIHGNSESEKYLSALLKTDSLVHYQEAGWQQVRTGDFSKQQIIFLTQLPELSSGLTASLAQFIRQGGTVVFFPAKNGDLESYNQFITEMQGNPYSATADTTSMHIAKLDVTNPLFQDVFSGPNPDGDLPEVKIHFPSQTVQSKALPILTLANGNLLLSESQPGKGKFFLFTLPSTSENRQFFTHALFVPLIYKMVLNSVQGSPLYYTIGRNKVIDLPFPGNGNSQGEMKLLGVGNSFDWLPTIQPLPGNRFQMKTGAVTKAGNYKLTSGNGALPLAFNYNRKESEPVCYDASQLTEQLQHAGFKQVQLFTTSDAKISDQFNVIHSGRQLWRFFLIMAIGALLAEVLIIRFWK
ncbi:hypothetical protein PbJCM13498_05720 [Prolixibacter bellariivorans]|uniref:Aerotolerance regulator N-terminal domain-containing protein n=1 Tax=Prolixibacter bellariivorans TaxID=314319 RepID=A0A5M4AUT6_9BACT|nr:BatA and WFA domain-containing protein [Prolixibacter bellariivorans]GET31709.1 hypothetical protein PbJCM13498_05720 [Prolixibacter bellariivorans]